jgi:hypothetical protein
MGMGSDLSRELGWQQAVEVLDRVAAILSHNERVNSKLAKLQEHYPNMPKFAAQLEVKRRVVESDPRGGRELWARVAALKQSRNPRR